MGFLDALSAMRSEPCCVVIFTLRADFSGALMESPLWPERPAQILRIELTPLRGKALRDAIATPAERVGATVEPALIERLVADAASEPGILPLLQETLVQLWDARKAPAGPRILQERNRVLGGDFQVCPLAAAGSGCSASSAVPVALGRHFADHRLQRGAGTSSRARSGHATTHIPHAWQASSLGVYADLRPCARLLSLPRRDSWA